MGRGFEIPDGSVGRDEFAFFADDTTIKLAGRTGRLLGRVFGVGHERVGGKLSGDPLADEVGGAFDVAEGEAARIGKRVVVELP